MICSNLQNIAVNIVLLLGATIAWETYTHGEVFKNTPESKFSDILSYNWLERGIYFITPGNSIRLL